MPVLTITEQTYNLLAEQAARRHVSIEEVVAAAVAQLRQPEAEQSGQPTWEERLRAFERLTQSIEAEAHRYPPGHRIDDSRESIYAERENAQL